MSSSHLHHASPWVIDTRALGLLQQSGPGHAEPLDVTAPAPADVSTGDLTVAEDVEVTVTGRLESVSEGVLVTGIARATASGSCARCLREITVDVDTDFRELFAYPDSLTAETTDPDEVPRINDELIDLEPLVHDELVLALPTIALCRPDCAGLCPECGILLDDAEPGHGHETIDPRWAGLAGLFGADSGEISDREPTGDPAGNSEEN